MHTPKTYKVTVRRIEHREHVFEVEAVTEKEARLKALDVSEDHDFDQNTIHYTDHEDVACEVVELFGVRITSSVGSEPDKMWGPYVKDAAEKVCCAYSWVVFSDQFAKVVPVGTDTKFDARPALPSVNINFEAYKSEVDGRFAEAERLKQHDFDLRKHVTENLIKYMPDAGGV